ncbi:MAG: hypothetical protein AVDCRST_MAG93-10002, partial [uncultured Chloroflexia bacterium]
RLRDLLPVAYKQQRRKAADLVTPHKPWLVCGINFGDQQSTTIRFG